MNYISLLIKPASGSCNMQCGYCFYRDVAENRDTFSYGVMSQETLENIVRKALSYGASSVCFGFQGGEPTLAGIDFYIKLIEYQNKYKNNNTNIINTIQTNGILINDEWAAFLSENDFLTGLSLDGPKDSHDFFRKDYKGEGSFDRVMHAAEMLTKHDAQYNILTVVTKYVAKHIDKIYNFFKKSGFKYLQFIPCLEPLGDERGGQSYLLDNKTFSYFLKGLFDKWYADLMSGNYISVRQFDNYTQMVAGYPPESCAMSGICGKYFVVEADGSIYPCDFYVLDKWLMGNVNQDEFADMFNSPVGDRFIKESLKLSDECRACKYHFICRGGCKRDRTPDTVGIPYNYYCAAYKEFFDYSLDRLGNVARMLSKGTGITK